MAAWLNELRLRLKTLLRRRQMEQDFEDEMAFHLAMREEKLREAGVADAGPAARRKFGNVTRTKEDCREAWTFAGIERLWADIRIGARLIARNRWAMLAVIVSLSLGIGSAAAVFNLFDSLLFRPLQVPETERVVRIASLSNSGPFRVLLSNLDFEELRRRTQSFEGIATYSPGQLPQIATRSGHAPRAAFAVLVSGEFFSSLGFEPVAGRGFRPEEDEAPGRDAVAVISSGLWRREYGADREIVGKTIWINSKEFTIAGVAPEGVDSINGFGKPEVYLPRLMEGMFGNEATLTDRTARRLQLFGRLKNGISAAQARDEVSRIAFQLEQEHPDSNRGLRMMVYTQLGFKMANTPEAFIAAGLFFTVVGLVLVIACVNAGSLLLSTAPARTREMAIRVALGSGRARLVRQMLIESVMVSAGGALAGLGIAALCARFITSIELFANTPFKLDIHLDTRVALFALAIGIVAGILSGLLPALRCSQSNLNTLLKTEDSRLAGSGRMRVRQLLVVVQVAVAVTVLVVCGFSLQQLRLMRKVDPGFRVENVLRAPFSSITPNATSYRPSLEKLRSLPGVRAAAAAYPEPLGVGDEATNLLVEGFALPPDQPSLPITTAVVTDGYFEALDIPILRGRAFEVGDMGENTRVAIINEEMANRYWPNHDALGSQIRTVGPSLADNHAVTLEIVGIARTAKYRNLSEAPLPFLYLPLRQAGSPIGAFFVVTEADPAAFASTLRRELNVIDPNAPAYDIGTMSQHVRHGALVFERLTAQVLTGVAVVGLILSVIGLYGIVAYSVSQRTHEIGVRMAIGATRRAVLRLVLAQGLKLGAIGIVAGVMVSNVLSSSLDVFLRPPNSSAPDPTGFLVYVVVVALSIVVTAFACYLPARRASMVDPNVALRSE